MPHDPADAASLWVMPWNNGGDESVRRSVEWASMASRDSHSAQAKDVRWSAARRRTILALSMIGLASLAMAALYHTGVLRHWSAEPIAGPASDRAAPAPSSLRGRLFLSLTESLQAVRARLSGRPSYRRSR